MQQDSHTPSSFERNLSVVALVLLLAGCFLVARPFLSALMWAIILSFCLWPVQRRLVALMRGRRTPAALLSTLTIAMVLLAPLVFIGFRLPEDARAVTAATHKWLQSGPPVAPKWIEKVPLAGPSGKAYWDKLAVDAVRMMQQADSDDQAPPEPPASTTAPTQQAPRPSSLLTAMQEVVALARSWLISAGLAIGRGIFDVALSVFFTFFLFRDGEALAERLGHGLTRIAGDRGRHLMKVAGSTVRGVVYGILGTALAQGLVAGIGFWIAGVPGAPLLALLTALLSMLPIGPPLIWIPASLWLFHRGSTGWGVFMLAWGMFVSSLDNIIKPWIISQGSDMPFILIFVGVLGGVVAFGLIGVFLGPTLLAVGYRLLHDWLDDPQRVQQDRQAAPHDGGR